jgi:hypothetical protein
MEYIVEVLTREGQICERYATYAEARRRVERLPVDIILGVPLIFRELTDGSQRLMREDGKLLQWHRLEEDRSEDFEQEPLQLDEDVPIAPDGGPAIRKIEPRTPWDEEDARGAE